MTQQLFLVLLFFTSDLHMLVIEDNVARPDCEGSLVFNTRTGERRRVVGREGEVFIVARTVRLGGCGCYRVFARKYWRGRSQAITRQGLHRIVIRTIQSVTRIECFDPPASNNIDSTGCQPQVSNDIDL